MARPRIRTVHLSLDVINRVIGLFGTVQNAWRQLGLADVDVQYQILYTALNFKPITPPDRDKIEEAWARWRLLFLRPEVPVSDPLAVTFENRDELPAWFPQTKRKK